MRGLAFFILLSQETSGKLRSKYYPEAGRWSDFDSSYYPGEAIYALTRYARTDNNPLWLHTAAYASVFLAQQHDEVLVQHSASPDHWLLKALGELLLVDPNPVLLSYLRRNATQIADSLCKRSSVAIEEWRQRSAPVATRAEALAAAIYLELQSDPNSDISNALAALEQAMSFCLDLQLGPNKTIYLPNPLQALGGVRRSLVDWRIRIDYVQHTLSAALRLMKIYEALKA